MENLILSLTTFFPVVGILLILMIPKEKTDTIKGIALIISIVTMILAIAMYAWFDPLASGMQFDVNVPWISAFGINYHFGIDGISLLLIVMTTILSVLSILASWNSIKTGVKGYFISMLLLNTDSMRSP